MLLLSLLMLLLVVRRRLSLQRYGVWQLLLLAGDWNRDQDTSLLALRCARTSSRITRLLLLQTVTGELQRNGLCEAGDLHLDILQAGKVSHSALQLRQIDALQIQSGGGLLLLLLLTNIAGGGLVFLEL